MKKYLLATIFTAGCSVLLYSSIVNSQKTTGNNGKVTICHCPPGNPDNCQTISVSVNAVNAHLNHGDIPGACSVTEEMGIY